MLPAGEDEPRPARPRREDGGSEEPSVLPWKSVGRAPRAELATPRAREPPCGRPPRAAGRTRRLQSTGLARSLLFFVFCFSRGSRFKLPLASVLSAYPPCLRQTEDAGVVCRPRHSLVRDLVTSGESLAGGGSVAPSVGRR